MLPRSANDKEYFAQDWFEARVQELGLSCQQQGRNSYPDFLLGNDSQQEGYELKALGCNNGRPARKDIDFNSTIPSGFRDGRNVFLVFFLYTGTGATPRDIHTMVIAHGDLINSDHALAAAHDNISIHEFGSYADGFIRDRKMYVFPHPVTILPSCLGQQRLIVPKSWNVSDLRLRKVTTQPRTIARESIESYTIQIQGAGQASVTKKPSPNAGQMQEFDVFELL